MGESDLVPVNRAHFVQQQLREIKTGINDLFLQMGKYLLEAFRDNHHRELGFPTFESYVESPETLDMSFRRAKYLLDIYDVGIEKLNVPQADIVEVGWTRFKELLPVINEDNKEKWVSFAKTHTTSQINLEVRRVQATPDQRGEVKAYIHFTVGVYEDELERIQEAMELAKLEGETKRPGRALLLICESYAPEIRARRAEAADAT